MGGQFRILPAFKKVKDFCKYQHLGISKKKLEVSMLIEKIKFWETSNGFY